MTMVGQETLDAARDGKHACVEEEIQLKPTMQSAAAESTADPSTADVCPDIGSNPKLEDACAGKEDTKDHFQAEKLKDMRKYECGTPEPQKKKDMTS
jgi:hypothetical protein